MVWVDTEFLLECSTQCLRSEHSKQVKYKVEHNKRNSISTSSHVVFCLLYKHTNNDIFNNFLNISNHFLNIS